MMHIRLLLVTLVGVVLFSKTLLADVGVKTPQSYSGVGILLMWMVCSRRKKEEIGGWLLYYYIQLYLAALVVIAGMIASFGNYMPAIWKDKWMYMLFILSTLPGIFLFILQVVTATIAMKTRAYKWIVKLRFILMLDIIFTLLAMIIDSQYFRENMVFNFMSIVWPVIWLPYFYKSVRVQRVFVTKDWLAKV